MASAPLPISLIILYLFSIFPFKSKFSLWLESSLEILVLSLEEHVLLSVLDIINYNKISLFIFISLFFNEKI